MSTHNVSTLLIHEYDVYFQRTDRISLAFVNHRSLAREDNESPTMHRNDQIIWSLRVGISPLQEQLGLPCSPTQTLLPQLFYSSEAAAVSRGRSVIESRFFCCACGLHSFLSYFLGHFLRPTLITTVRGSCHVLILPTTVFVHFFVHTINHLIQNQIFGSWRINDYVLHTSKIAQMQSFRRS